MPARFCLTIAGTSQVVSLESVLCQYGLPSGDLNSFHGVPKSARCARVNHVNRATITATGRWGVYAYLALRHHFGGLVPSRHSSMWVIVVETSVFGLCLLPDGRRRARWKAVHDCALWVRLRGEKRQRRSTHLQDDFADGFRHRESWSRSRGVVMKQRKLLLWLKLSAAQSKVWMPRQGQGSSAFSVNTNVYGT